MNITIIGTSYVGLVTGTCLADLGNYVVCLDVDQAKIDLLNSGGVHIYEEDIKNFDVVVMLAGISNDPFGNLSYEEVYDPTRNYAIKIAQICKKLGVRYIFPSSCSVYGDGADGSELNEDSPTNPLTPYSLNKLQIEQDLSDLSDENFSPIALRFGTVFGCSPRIRFDVVINMLCGMAVSEKQRGFFRSSP